MPILVPLAYQYAQYTGANSRVSAKSGELLRYFFGEWDFSAIVRRVDAMRLLALSAICQIHPIFFLLNWLGLSIEDICHRSLCCVALGKSAVAGRGENNGRSRTGDSWSA